MKSLLEKVIKLTEKVLNAFANEWIHNHHGQRVYWGHDFKFSLTPHKTKDKLDDLEESTLPPVCAEKN